MSPGFIKDCPVHNLPYINKYAVNTVQYMWHDRTAPLCSTSSSHRQLKVISLIAQTTEIKQHVTQWTNLTSTNNTADTGLILSIHIITWFILFHATMNYLFLVNFSWGFMYQYEMMEEPLLLAPFSFDDFRKSLISRSSSVSCHRASSYQSLTMEIMLCSSFLLCILLHSWAGSLYITSLAVVSALYYLRFCYGYSPRPAPYIISQSLSLNITAY